ncbi:Aerobic cobaltochelatase subunit CobN [Zhongshania aliphaticivorans]|uniref:Aerobic cobaltochelatase subunit CobN n=1 Tax=Zhongshania aliphaticivorans TaxID=1470434 RepID=A0A5S9P300_9GAMM|nr:cobaltochelatase subunit CobN [Zhongshania aliphaticivorans]CAA0090279.1 Aerobic cobaltochelatase subunit CobN [Zhongshania aliphaticivorans]CAA0097691.1 Aerobic cobaltochelatase subunit CobN [Zhongshania aliphaticivorans]
MSTLLPIADLLTSKRRQRMSFSAFLFITLFSLFGTNLSLAATNTLTAIVSDRSAPTLIASAHQLLQEKTEVQIRIRTVSQIIAMDDRQLQTLISNSQSLLFIAVFGEPVERLLNQRFPASQKRTVLHSDRRLMALQRDRHGDIFASSIPEDVVGDRDAVIDEPSLTAKQAAAPPYADWLQARAYWVNRSVDNGVSLFNFILSNGKQITPAQAVAPLRFAVYQNDQANWLTPDKLTQALKPMRRTLWIIDHDGGDISGDWALHQQLCQATQWQCVSILAGWGEPSVAAISQIHDIMRGSLAGTPAAIVTVQDFVIGGGEGREKVTQLLTKINLPILKAVRLSEWSEAEWALSPEGIPRDSVHYRVAMPELQGISQPQVLALAEPSGIDPLTGGSLYRSKPIDNEVKRQAQRLTRWMTLQEKANADKRIGVVYYNHPPGRHNIGADNLNVPESLLEMLQAMKAAGYKTGPLPKDANALLDKLQATGVNLPDDRAALSAMSTQVNTISGDDYQAWFATLPKVVQAEMVNGPLGELQVWLQEQVDNAVALESVTERQSRLALISARMSNTISDLQHALDGVRDAGRARALDLLAQTEAEYQAVIQRSADGGTPNWQSSEKLVKAIIDMGIEGIRGWGTAPGRVMVWKNKILIPGVQFGNVFLGPQPPRGWEINEELLHANMSFPPPHQYLGFYHYINDVFKADALVHVGRHSTYEFLPKRSVGLSENDYPSIAVGDLPSVYPYIVDGVGEGIQAKRRGLAVMIDHLTPPLAATELYDSLLEIRQLIESAEAANDADTRARAVKALRDKIDETNLRDELIASMDEELKVRGIGFEETDDSFLLHEVGHYLTKLQESFMPLGLHVFGRNWQPDAVDTMISSMLQGDNSGNDKSSKDDWRNKLIASPAAEMSALLNGLNGHFVEPGKGNDPIRTPESLPTGRNFYALDGSLLPTRVGFEVGTALAAKVLSGESGVAIANTDTHNNKQGIILWASDAVRDEGAMIAFGMKLLGVQPVWNSRGIIKGLARLPLGPDQPQRLDVVFTTSGLFRDLYGKHLLLLDKAGLMALDASSDRIRRDYPALTLALNKALAPLGEAERGGNETFEQNQFANNWVNEARELLAANPSIKPDELGRQTSLRVFGIAPGGYGAGINRLVERSGAWQDRSELADVFIKRMGHAYGAGMHGQSAQDQFKRQLQSVSQTFLGRASNLYGLIDNNDAFDYLGGFNLAVETVSGKVPASAVINHADNRNLQIDALHDALLSELRGRFFNPQWIKPLMEEGYSGARTMGSEFIEYLWGWQVTSPDIINDKVWEEVKSVYIDDAQNLGLKAFLADDNNRYVQTNILAVMLVAIDKGFWAADADTTQQLAEQFANNIIEHGNPGSGHTHARHPMYDLVKSQLSAKKAEQLEAKLQSSRMDDADINATNNSAKAPSHIQEIEIDKAEFAAQTAAASASASQAKATDNASDSTQSQASDYLAWLVGIGVILMLGGLWRGRRSNR